MKDLIEALTILAKYTDSTHPTSCDHDVLRVSVDPALVSAEDKARLDELGFFPEGDEEDPDYEPEFFESYRFGSN